MVDDPRNRLQPDGPFADAGVAILAAGEGHQAVVQVDGVQLAQPDMPVELLQHPVTSKLWVNCEVWGLLFFRGTDLRGLF